MTSAEGHILLTGLSFALIYLAGIGICFLWSSKNGNLLAGMTMAHVFFGRAAGLSFGYAAELGHGTVIPVSMIIETILVLLFYPLFVLCQFAQ